MKRLVISILAATMLVSAACSDAPTRSARQAKPGGSNSPQQLRRDKPKVTPVLGGACQGTCQSGRVQLGNQAVLPGLKLTLPSGWSISDYSPAEFDLVPPDAKDHRVLFWTDPVAVKSTGSGHGTTVLKSIGRTPQALISWLTHNPDFHIDAQPESVVIAHGIKMTSLTLDVSRSANYGEPACPGNPRCADLFTNKLLSAEGDFFGIGGTAVDQFYLGTIHNHGQDPGAFHQFKPGRHTFLIGLDALSPTDLEHLKKAATPIIESLRLP